jgi:hypothetical protein
LIFIGYAYAGAKCLEKSRVGAAGNDAARDEPDDEPDDETEYCEADDERRRARLEARDAIPPDGEIRDQAAREQADHGAECADEHRG